MDQLKIGFLHGVIFTLSCYPTMSGRKPQLPTLTHSLTVTSYAVHVPWRTNLWSTAPI